MLGSGCKLQYVGGISDAHNCFPVLGFGVVVIIV